MATPNQWIWSRTLHCLKPLSRVFFWIWRTCETSCTNVNTPRYPLGTSVNTTYIQVPSLEFGHSDGDRVQGQVQCRGPDTTRTQKWVPGTSLCHCVHEIFFSSGGSGSTALCTMLSSWFRMVSERSKWSNNVHIHLHTRAGLFKAGLR